MDKKDYINMFNGIIRGDPMISGYLTEINYEKYSIRDILVTDNIQLS